jgi:hypothetical protein
MSTTTLRKPGELVGVTGTDKYPGTWEILKVNPTTYALRNVDTGERLRASHEYVTDPPTPGAPQAVPLPAALPLGTIVTIRNAPQYPGLHVVIADKGEKVNVARLGGSAEEPYRYVRCHRSLLTVVDPVAVLRG